MTILDRGLVSESLYSINRDVTHCFWRADYFSLEAPPAPAFLLFTASEPSSNPHDDAADAMDTQQTRDSINRIFIVIAGSQCFDGPAGNLHRCVGDRVLSPMIT